MIIRDLTREEIWNIWDEIDRSEVIEHIYYLRDGELVLEEEYYDMRDWPSGARERSAPTLYDCFDRGGTFYGAFDDALNNERMVGVAVLESAFMGEPRDQLQLQFLHVSSDYRKRGLGKALFERAVARAREMGARRLYVSATPSENTVNFYRSLGCTLAERVDPHLFELEPEDIHLEYAIPPKK